MISLKLSSAEINIGDTLRVKTTVVEGGKSRIQTFEGILISLRGRGEDKTMTVRRIGARAVGVERTWPVTAKSIVGIEVVKKASRVRRSKLYYLRNLTGRAAIRI